MTELSIKDYIRNGLFFEAQSVALDFVSFLEEKRRRLLQGQLRLLER